MPTITIYSELERPIPVPAQENCRVMGVSAILDSNRHIVEVHAHISTRPE